MPSPDGKWIYYTKMTRSTSGFSVAIWKVPPDGGEESPLLEAPLQSVFTYCVRRSGIYFASKPDSSPTTRLELYRFADRTTVEFARLDRPLRIQLSVSPDEKWLAFALREFSINDMILVENFR
jgi:hypothetical protein